MLPSRQWARPEAPVVKVSAVCTAALAVAGGMPTLSSTEVEMTP